MPGNYPRHNYKSRTWTEEMDDFLAYFYCFEGEDFPEIARALGLTTAAVAARQRMLGLCYTPQAVAARRARGIYRGFHPGLTRP